MPCTPYIYTIEHIHCHCKRRDVKRRHRQSVVPAPGREEEEPMPTTREGDDDDGPPVSKTKGATFQRRPPRTHSQCTHTLGTKDEGNSNLQDTSSLEFVACSCHFCVFGLWRRTQSPSSCILLTKHPSHLTHIQPANVRAYQLVTFTLKILSFSLSRLPPIYWKWLHLLVFCVNLLLPYLTVLFSGLLVYTTTKR
jgi:hypothetical protein